MDIAIIRAKNDTRVQSLLAEVQSSCGIQFKRVNGEYWGAKVLQLGKKAVIEWSETSHPGAALAHELLHVRMQHNGYRRLEKGISNIDNTERFRQLMVCLDNELQHHRMFEDFLSLGFAPEEFYADNDATTFDFLQRRSLQPDEDFLDLLPVYMTLIAPGGSLTQEQKQQLHHRFRGFRNGAFRVAMDEVDKAIQNWRSAADYDVTDVVRRLIRTIKNPSSTWIGHAPTDFPPHQGFFIDDSFEVRTPIEP